MNDGWNKVIQHNSLQKFPLEDSCIDVVITSPPYWGLRDYGNDDVIGGNTDCEHIWNEYTKDANTWSTPNKNIPSIMQSTIEHQIVKEQQQGYCKKCGAWRGQLGLEPHPQMYIEHLVSVAREIKRVLKKSGSFYLNLGDTYCGGVGQKDTGVMALPPEGFRKEAFRDFDGKWLQPKQLLLIPVRVAIALQEDGWILRNDIIWHKPNPMPSSVKDRLNTTYEHVFHFVKNRKYYYNLDAIRVPHTVCGVTDKRPMGILRQRLYPNSKYNKCSDSPIKNPKYKGQDVNPSEGHIRRGKELHDAYPPGYNGHPSGKNPGDTVESWNWRAGMNRDKTEIVEIRINLPCQKDFVDYLKPKIKEFEKQLDEIFTETKWRHWIRYDDSGFAFPSKEDWITLKQLLNLDDTFDLTQTELKYNAVYNNPKGKSPGDFWDINTQPFTSFNPELEHFAVFPEELIEKPLKASCPKDGVVLDPFCGRGTVGKVAKQLGLNYILWDVKPEYVKLAYLYVNGQKRKLIKYQQELKWLDT